MFSSQDDISYTPREHIHAPKFASSPKGNRKKGSRINELDLNLINSADFQSQTLLPQESPGLSQFSVDFSERLGQFCVRINQDDYMLTNETENTGEEDEVFSSMDSGKFNYYSISTNSISNSYATVDSAQKKPSNSYSSKQPRTPRVDAERQIDLRPVHPNPFLHRESHPVEQYFHKYFHIPKGPTKLFVGAYKERSRLITEFEELTLLGEGTFSNVYCVRHRIDGTLYAIKKIKEKFMSENHYNLLLREICALSMLRHCPHMIQYYNSWIDDAHLYIQLELCHLGTLEDMISSIPSKSSIFRIAKKPFHDQVAPAGSHHHHNNPDDLHASSDSYMTENNSIACTRSNSFGADCNIFETFLESSFFNQNHRGISEEFGWFVLKIVSETLDYMHQFNMVHLDIRPANVFIQSAHDVVLQRNSPIPNSEESTSTLLPPPPPPISSSSEALTTNTLSIDDPLLEETLLPTMKDKDIRTEVETSILKGEYCLKLGDLGHARHLEEHIPVIEGETRYCPRELIELDASNVDLRKCDIFSLGMSVYELCLGRFLGSQDEDGQSEWVNIRDGIFQDEFCDTYSDGFVDMIRSLLHAEPTQRPSAHSVAQSAVKQLNALNNMLSPPAVSSVSFQNKGIPGSHKTLSTMSMNVAGMSSGSCKRPSTNTSTNSSSNMNGGMVGGLPPMIRNPSVTSSGYKLPPPVPIPVSGIASTTNSNSLGGSVRTTPVSMERENSGNAMNNNTAMIEQLQRENDCLQLQVQQLLRQLGGISPSLPLPPPSSSTSSTAWKTAYPTE